jgi:hypothetical protein
LKRAFRTAHEEISISLNKIIRVILCLILNFVEKIILFHPNLGQITYSR